ncbi:MAG TPA: molybdopterin synthase catalytic subunit MoaE [Pseudomonadales bacterium]|nr:molybdopterin synthase catalytic subunit MoaE [Pseudomonadales bacterium]
MYIRISQQDFDIKEEYGFLSAADSAGAIVTFSGLVRSQGERGELLAMELECYPGMTEASITAIVGEAEQKWPLEAVRVIHRIGRLQPGDNIVFVGVSASHRAAAFAAAEFIMDYLKTRAPFWKKEITAGGEYWVEQKQKDEQAAERW